MFAEQQKGEIKPVLGKSNSWNNSKNTREK